MSILRTGVKGGTFIEQMEGLVRLCSAKRINIRPGTRPSTNGKDTIYLPWLPNDASEEDKLRFFNYAAHEQSHFFGGSVVSAMSMNKTRHTFENAVDDLRCERLQEEDYPGLKEYRIPFYMGYTNKMLAGELNGASASKNLLQFLHAVQCYAILKVRYNELGITDPIGVNDEVLAAYNKYVADLIPRIKMHRTHKETLEIGGLWYDRMKDMIREAMESKTPPPPKPKEKKDGGSKSESKDSCDDTGGEGEESEETGSSDKKDSDDKSGESGDPAESGDGSDEEVDEGSEGDSDGDSSAPGREELDKSGDNGKDDGADDEEGSGDSEDVPADDAESDSKEDDSPSGESSTDDSGNSDNKGVDDGTSDDAGDTGSDDSSSGSDEGTDGDDDTASDSPSTSSGDGEEGSDERGDRDSSDDSEASDHDEGESSDTPDESRLPEGTPEDRDSTDDVDDGPDPVAEYEEARREWETKIVEAVEEALKDIEDHAEELKTIHDENKEAIEEHSASCDAPYMVSPSVRDVIRYNDMAFSSKAEGFRNKGLRVLGSAGSRLTRVFVAESYPRHIRNQYHGRFDMRSFIADPVDRRTDIYSRKMGARLDKAAVSFMIDNSSSMRHCIDSVYAILSGLLHYLGRANIPTEAVGFTAGDARSPDYRDVPVTLSIVKKFEDPYNGDVIRRCVPPEYMNQNAEVDCLRYMVPRLMARPETKKVLFILGDGDPCIGNIHLNDKLAAAYKEYIELCKQAGIIVFGFGINCDLSWVFGEDFVSVDPTDVGDKLLTKLTEVLSRPTVHMKRLAA